MRTDALRSFRGDTVANYRTPALLTATVLALAFSNPGSGAAPLPTVPIREEGACPFECCIYREWTAEDTILVYLKERDTTKVAFLISPGDSFDALTGNQYVLKLGLVIVTDTIPEGWSHGSPLVPGDSIWLLSNGIEGDFPAWEGGGRFTALFEWWANGLDGGSGEGDVCKLIEWPETEWWVKIKAKSGRVGWIKMEGVHVSGSDQCA